jgi:hypothetical protein
MEHPIEAQGVICGLSGRSKRSAIFLDRTFLFAIGGAFTTFLVRSRKRQFKLKKKR